MVEKITIYTTQDDKFYDSYRDGEIKGELIRIKIPLISKELKPIENFEKYDETSYLGLRFEIEEYNDFINKYLKRKGAIVSNNNLEKNIYIKHLEIKKLEKEMKVKKKEDHFANQ